MFLQLKHFNQKQQIANTKKKTTICCGLLPAFFALHCKHFLIVLTIYIHILTTYKMRIQNKNVLTQNIYFLNCNYFFMKIGFVLWQNFGNSYMKRIVWKGNLILIRPGRMHRHCGSILQKTLFFHIYSR